MGEGLFGYGRGIVTAITGLVCVAEVCAKPLVYGVVTRVQRPLAVNCEKYEGAIAPFLSNGSTSAHPVN
jgi:Na+/serine symporter